LILKFSFSFSKRSVSKLLHTSSVFTLVSPQRLVCFVAGYRAKVVLSENHGESFANNGQQRMSAATLLANCTGKKRDDASVRTKKTLRDALIAKQTEKRLTLPYYDPLICAYRRLLLLSIPPIVSPVSARPAVRPSAHIHGAVRRALEGSRTQPNPPHTRTAPRVLCSPFDGFFRAPKMSRALYSTVSLSLP